MSIHSNRFTLKLRDLGRRMGLNRILQSFILGKEYEARYDHCLSEQIQVGDCVWDIGANLGYYSTQFAAKVQSGGRVYAFEPSHATFSRLTQKCVEQTNIECLNVGIGEEDGEAVFRQGSDQDGATSRVLDNSQVTGVKVKIRSGQSLVENDGLKPPNIIKIDVEGLELEVLRGFRDHLSRTTLRAIGVEIHFAILKDRGCPEAAGEIEALLKSYKFIVRWLDPSHIVATRK